MSEPEDCHRWDEVRHRRQDVISLSTSNITTKTSCHRERGQWSLSSGVIGCHKGGLPLKVMLGHDAVDMEISRETQ